MHDALIQLVPALGAALLHFVWQGSLLGLLAALVLARLDNARPHTRYAVTCVALLVALLLPILTVGMADPAAGATASAPVLGLSHWATTTSAIAPRSSRQRGCHWPQAPLRELPTPYRGWLPAGRLRAGALALRMFAGLYWVARLRQRAWAESTGVWQASAHRMAVRLGLRSAVPVRLSNDTATPLAVGWWQPMVLLPVSLVLHMPAPLLEALIAHELAHIRRHDYLVNLLQGVAETLLFYHPVVWWLSRRIRNERELIADALAANALGDGRRLALALAELDRSFDTPTPPLLCTRRPRRPAHVPHPAPAPPALNRRCQRSPAAPAWPARDWIGTRRCRLVRTRQHPTQRARSTPIAQHSPNAATAAARTACATGAACTARTARTPCATRTATAERCSEYWLPAR